MDRQLRVFICESLTAMDFYIDQREGPTVQEFLRLIDCPTQYRIALTPRYLERAIKEAVEMECDVFHLSCHGDATGITLTNTDSLSWAELAEILQPLACGSRALVMSSCVGGHGDLARAFEGKRNRFGVLFGASADDPPKSKRGKTVAVDDPDIKDAADHVLQFEEACLAWPILYRELYRQPPMRSAYLAAVAKLCTLFPGNRFVCHCLSRDGERYLTRPVGEPADAG
jgi:hypothetical protein